jgi:2-dehydro-3-deoxygluconokinase
MPMDPIEIAAFGECMIEISDHRGAVAQGFGGDTLNTLLYLARLLPEQRGHLHYLTGLGEDPYSAQMLRQWQVEGINTDLVARLPDRLPGLYAIRTDPTGERRFYYWRRDAAVREVLTPEFGRRMQQACTRMGLFYLSGISVGILPAAARRRLLKAVELMQRRGVRVVFDSNYRPALWQDAREARQWMQAFLPHIDLALVTFADEQALHADQTPEAVVARLNLIGIPEVVVKNGVEPCLVGLGGQVDAYPLNIRVKPVDTTAAGDAFNAAYLAARLARWSVRDAVTAGNKLAGIVVQHPGAIAPQDETPTLEQLHE